MTIFYLPKQVAVTSSGIPLAFSKLYFYKAGTTTDQTVYNNADLAPAHAHAQPVVADATGTFPVIYLDPNAVVDYRVQLKSVLGALIYDQDNYPKSGVSGTTVLSTQLSYAQTAAESAASVTPTNTSIPSHDAIGIELPARQGWNTGASGTTNYTALSNAHAVALQARTEIDIGAGIVPYKPSAEFVSQVDIVGHGMHTSTINCDTSSFTGRFFRLTDSAALKNCIVETIGLTGLGTGVFVSDVAIASATGYQRLEHVLIQGFAKGLEIGNVFINTYDQLRIQNNTEGVWSVPDGSGGNGFNTTQLFLNCDLTGNVRNVHWNPPINCIDICFEGGSIENATGATAQADFTNVSSLTLRNVNGEGATGINWLALSSVSYFEMDNCTLSQDCGPISITDTSTIFNIKNFHVVGTHCKLLAGGTTNQGRLENCSFPASGNTFPANTRLINTTINGTYYADSFYDATSFSGNRIHRTQTLNISAATADVYRFVDINGTVMNTFVSGTFYIKVVDHSGAANVATYELDIVSNNNTTTDATLSPVRRQVRGTDPGTSATPFSLANDGASGAVKLQFTKNGAIAAVDVVAQFIGLSIT